MRIPDDREIGKIGSQLGFDFTDRELLIVGKVLRSLLPLFQEADALPPPPPPEAGRQPIGHRSWRTPTRAEDPYNAFLHMCDIQETSDGPLADLTVALKDNIALAGVPLTLGTRFFSGYIPEFDATIVTRLLRAGARIIGKTNMDPLSTGGASGGSRDYGRVLNPRSPESSPGGSSSGSAAAVAGGLVDVAFGGDQMGSIRFPAAWCGVVGLKATHGLIPHTGVIGTEFFHDHVGPIGPTVESVARVLNVVAGPDHMDLRATNAPQLPNYLQSLTGDIAGMQIGILAEGFPEATQPDVRTAALDAIGTLEELGMHARQVSVPVHGSVHLAAMPYVLESLAGWYDRSFVDRPHESYVPLSFIEAMGRAKAGSASQIPLVVKTAITLGTYIRNRYYGRYAALAQRFKPTMTAAYDEAMLDVDVLAMPTVLLVATEWETGNTLDEQMELAMVAGESGLSDLASLTANLGPFNFTGHPALTVPCGWSNGKPIGLQLVGAKFSEDKLLRVGFALQRALTAMPP